MINTYVLLGISLTAMVASGVAGYFLGRYQTNLLEQIRTLQARPVEAPPEPEKPTVTGGAYQPPKETSNTVDNRKAAGIVETKTPQQLEWENQNELHKLETSG